MAQERYTPGLLLGERVDPEYLLRELNAIARRLDYILDGYREIRHVEPERPEEGMIVIADGTDWNPGSGAGVYTYLSSTWTKL